MLADRYGLPLSTASSAARDAYVQGCEAKLTMYPGALEGFDRAIAASPRSSSTCALAAWARAKPGSAAMARSNSSIAPGYMVSFASQPCT